MDTVGHARTMVDPSEPVMGVFAEFAERLSGTPRYLFDRAATRTMVELSLGRPKVLCEALAHLRIPYPRMWVEWDDADRQRLRDQFSDGEPPSYAELRPMPGRVGFLLEADPGGRSGHVTWMWTTPKSSQIVPNIGAVEPYFDLDHQLTMTRESVAGLLKGNLARMWLDNPVQLEALFQIWRTADHRPSKWGETLLAMVDSPLYGALAYADVVGEYIMVWAALLLLTASRPVIDLVPIDLGRLNRRRSKRGNHPLLDYTQVVMHLQEPDPKYNPVIRGPLGHNRKSPRVHLVSSYLARRGDKHWICQPYMRGKGETVHRRVSVKG
jgi:hypothetical protein